MHLDRRDLIIGAAASLAVCAARGAVAQAAIGTLNPLSLVDPEDGRTLPLRVVYPLRGTRLPIILFSHGLYSSKDDYNPILDGWAAHGYVVIAPTHRDSATLGVQRGTFEPRFLPWRMEDMRLILSQLPQVINAVPGLVSRADPTRIAAAGHSLGGLIAQSLSGATYRDSTSGTTIREAGFRVGATVIISGPGVIPGILRPEDFAGLTGPVLVSVGSNDLKQDPNLTGYEWRRQPYDLAPPGDKFLLTLDGADHYLGGNVGRDDLAKDSNTPQYLEAFNLVSRTFLDAYLRDEPRAIRSLRQRSRADQTAHLPPRSKLEAK